MIASHPFTIRRIAAIKAALADGILNAHQIAERIALCLARTEDYLSYLVEHKEIHVKRYMPPATGKQQPIAHYKLGAGRNARRPKPLTGQQKATLYRARVRQDDERYDRRLSTDRTNKRIRRMVKTPTTWLSALGA